MNFKGQLKFWLLFAAASSTLAFQPTIKNNDGMPSKPLDMTATLDASLLRNDIDISDVLAQTELALQAAQAAVPTSTSKSIGKEMKKLAVMQTEMEDTLATLSEGLMGGSDVSENNQLMATAVVGSAIGVVAGSPIMLGAALGVAGTQLLEGEKGEQTRKMLADASHNIAQQMQEVAAYAQTQIENEEDLSKVPEKMLLAFQDKIQEDLKEAQHAPQNLINAVKGTLESEDLKAAPGRAFNAFKTFMNSDEVKSAQKKAMKAIQDGLESEEMQALKTRASLALEETAKKSA
jgi:hypothetical protein